MIFSILADAINKNYDNILIINKNLDDDIINLFNKYNIVLMDNYYIITKDKAKYILGYSTEKERRQKEINIKNRLDYINQLNQINLEKSTTIINLFNPYHDKIGRFAKVKGNPSSAMIASSRDFAENKASKSILGGIVKTTGLVLGIGAGGVVGLAVIGASSAKIQEESKKEDLENQLNDTQAKLEELSANWPKFNNIEESVSYSVGVLNELGITEIPNDIKVSVQQSDKGIGQYDPTTNTLNIDPSLAEDLMKGTPSALDVMIHELAHSEQMVDGQDSHWGNSDEMVSDPDYYSKFSPLLEGQNDLVTLLAVSKIYGKGLDQEGIAKLSSEYKSLESEKSILSSMLDSNNDSGGNVKILGITSNSTQLASVPTIGYPEESKTWARLAVVGGEKSGVSAKQYLVDAHKYGFSQNESHQLLVDIFPEEMSSNGYYVQPSKGLFGIGASKAQRKWPTQSEINAWMDNHGYVSKDKALAQMLGAN